MADHIRDTYPNDDVDVKINGQFVYEMGIGGDGGDDVSADTYLNFRVNDIEPGPATFGETTINLKGEKV